jgi:hypothetical protein
MNCTNNLACTPFFDQATNIYNTQGELVPKTQQQIFSDNFYYYLNNNKKIDKPIYTDYVNKCYPHCCNPIKWDVSEKIIDIQYINSNVCNKNNQKKYRIG